MIHNDLFRSISRFREQGVNLDVKDIRISFQKAIGDLGTLLFPLFNFDMGKPFDIRNTPSRMEVLTEKACCLPRAVRTGHVILYYIYSFAIIRTSGRRG